MSGARGKLCSLANESDFFLTLCYYFHLIDLFHKNRKYVIVVETEFPSTVDTLEKPTLGGEN